MRANSWTTFSRDTYKAPKSLQKDYAFRTKFYHFLDNFPLPDGSHSEQHHRSARAKTKSYLAQSGAIHSRAAVNFRATYPNYASREARALREIVSLPPATGREIFTSLPAPHFAEVFEPRTAEDLLSLFRIGYSRRQLSRLSNLARSTFEATGAHHPSELPEDHPALVLIRALGEHYLARAILFSSRDDTQTALELLESIATTDAHHVDILLAQELMLPPQKKQEREEKWKGPLRDYGLTDPASIARAQSNSGIYEFKVQHRKNLRKTESDCLVGCNGSGCRPYDWLWPATPLNSKND